jgi:hypothetical protein
MLVRREVNNKLTGYPKLVCLDQQVNNPEDLDKVGAIIKYNGSNVMDVNNVITYLQPAQMSGEAAAMQQEIMTTTRDLAAAGDAALGQVNPEKASGAAIIAVQDQSAIPLNKQQQTFRQFIEDIAAIWFAVWVAYNPDELRVTYEEDERMISDVVDGADMRDMEVGIKIDVSPTNPVSKFAREQAIENAMIGGNISFEEYVEILDDDATAPKAKFKEVLENRALAQMNAPMGMEMPPEIGAPPPIPGMGDMPMEPGMPPGMGDMAEPPPAMDAGLMEPLIAELKALDPEAAAMAIARMELDEGAKQALMAEVVGG